jgi:glycosyltransferase involved in cell wall biosynthesis
MPRAAGHCMEVLSLNPYVPYPLNSGGALRSHHVLQALRQRHRVLPVCQWRAGEPAAEWAQTQQFEPAPVCVPCHEIHPRDPRIEASRHLAPRPWVGRPRQVCSHDFGSFWQALWQLPLDSFDVVHARHFQLTPYALAIQAQYSTARIVIDVDNVASVLAWRAMRAAKLRRLSRWRFRSYVELLRIASYERLYLRRADQIWVCSERDARLVSRWVGLQRVRIVPNGVDVNSIDGAQTNRDSRQLLFVGDFRYDPNEQGVLWFRHDVWPQVRDAVPDAELWIVGRDPTQRIAAMHQPDYGVHVVGEVPDVRPHLRRAAVSIVPLLVGGGTRLKVLEAMAAALPVVATAIGAEGIEVMDGREALIRDTPSSFAMACMELLVAPARRDGLGRAGRRLVEDRYDWSVIRKKAIECYEDLKRMPSE